MIRSIISVLICIALIVPPSLVSAPLELIYIDDNNLSRRELARLSRASQGGVTDRESQTEPNPSEDRKNKDSKISDFFKRFFVYQTEKSNEVDKGEVSDAELSKVDATENSSGQMDTENTEEAHENINEGIVTEVAKENNTSKDDGDPVLPKEFVYGKDEDKKEIVSTKRSGTHVRDSLLKVLHLLPDYFKKDARVVQYINDRLIPFVGNSTKNALKLSDFFIFLPGHRGQKNEIAETDEKKVISDSEEVQKQNNLDKEEGKEKDAEQRETFFSRLFKRDPNRVRKYDASMPEKVSLKKLLPFLVYSEQENEGQDKADVNEVVKIAENNKEEVLTSENRKGDESELESQEKMPVSSEQEPKDTLTTAAKKDKTLIDIMKIEQAKSDDEIVEKLAYSDPNVKESIEVIALRDKFKSDEKLHTENSEKNKSKSEKAEDIVELESDSVKEGSALASEKVEDEAELRTNTDEENSLKVVSENVADNLKVDEHVEDQTKLKSDPNENDVNKSSSLVEVKDKLIKERKRGRKKEAEGDAFEKFLLSLKDRVEQRSQDDWKPGGKDWFHRLRWFRPFANKKSEVEIENVDMVKGRGFATFVASVVDNETSAKTFFKRNEYKLNSYSTSLLMPLLKGDMIEAQKSGIHLHLYKEKLEEGTHIKLDKRTKIYFDEIQDFHYLLIQNGRVRLKNESDNMWVIIARENRIYVDRGDELVVDMTGELITKIITIEGGVDIYDEIRNDDITLNSSESYEIGIVSSRTELESSEIDFLNENFTFKLETENLKKRHIAARSFLTTLQNKEEIVAKSKPSTVGDECTKCSYQLKPVDKIQKYCPQCYQNL